jgi:hypothetical protein
MKALKFTKDRREAFFGALADTRIVTVAAGVAGVTRARAYQVRKAGPAFAAAWDEADFTAPAPSFLASARTSATKSAGASPTVRSKMCSMAAPARLAMVMLIVDPRNRHTGAKLDLDDAQARLK